MSVNIESSEPHQASFAHVFKDAHNRVRPTAVDTDSEENTLAFIRNGQDLLDLLPEDTEGLNLARIDEYCDTVGLSDTPTYFLRDKLFEPTVKLLGHTANEPSGIYFSGMGRILVKREEELEAINGPGLTESFAVHERAHSTHIAAPWRVTHTSTGKWLFKKSHAHAKPTRSGFRISGVNSATDTHGELLEEAYAEIERGLFIQQHDLVGDLTDGAKNSDAMRESVVPLHYFYKTIDHRDGQPFLTFSPGAFGATVLEMLIKEDPSLLTTLRASRHSVDGLRESAKQINAIVPGLYPRLLRTNDADAMIDIIGDLV
ncbi:MAG: hypothetical protein WAQ27_00435 [Candidatus Microsaccharimonas sp.]